MSQAELAAVMAAGQVEARVERVRRGLGAVAAPAAGVGVVPAAPAAAAGEIWLRGDKKIGDRVQHPLGFPELDGWGLRRLNGAHRWSG